MFEGSRMQSQRSIWVVESIRQYQKSGRGNFGPMRERKKEGLASVSQSVLTRVSRYTKSSCILYMYDGHRALYYAVILPPLSRFCVSKGHFSFSYLSFIVTMLSAKSRASLPYTTSRRLSLTVLKIESGGRALSSYIR